MENHQRCLLRFLIFYICNSLQSVIPCRKVAAYSRFSSSWGACYTYRVFVLGVRPLPRDYHRFDPGIVPIQEFLSKRISWRGVRLLFLVLPVCLVSVPFEDPRFQDMKALYRPLLDSLRQETCFPKFAFPSG